MKWRFFVLARAKSGQVTQRHLVAIPALNPAPENSVQTK
jgi:hypothetical protein